MLIVAFVIAGVWILMLIGLLRAAGRADAGASDTRTRRVPLRALSRRQGDRRDADRRRGLGAITKERRSFLDRRTAERRSLSPAQAAGELEEAADDDAARYRAC